MEIPNDQGHPWRLHKFVEYQHEVPAIDMATLVAYAGANGLAPDDLVVLSWLHSATYCEVTAIFLFEMMDWKVTPYDDLCSVWWHYKPWLVFNSARRYIKSMNQFPDVIAGFQQHLPNYQALVDLVKGLDKYEAYQKVYKTVALVPYTGPFAISLALEFMVWASRTVLWDVNVAIPPVLDWKHLSNTTSGICNVFYQDEWAETYDKTGRVLATENQLSEWRAAIQNAIVERYPTTAFDPSYAWLGKLCSFRNLFKGTRYGGFHHDRQLSQILAYQQAFPDHSLWERLFGLRRSLFKPSLLGEIGGWTGIRKERTKLWLRHGLTGVEDV